MATWKRFGLFLLAVVLVAEAAGCGKSGKLWMPQTSRAPCTYLDEAHISAEEYAKEYIYPEVSGSLALTR